MINQTQYVTPPFAFQFYVSTFGTTVHPLIYNPVPAKEEVARKEPYQTLYQQHIEKRNKDPFPVAFLEVSDITSVVGGYDSNRRVAILQDYITSLKQGILPTREGVLKEKKKEATVDGLNELLKSKNITPLAFFPKSKTAMMRQIYKAVKASEEEITLSKLSLTTGKDLELLAKYIVHYGKYDAEYNQIFQIDKEFDEIFSKLENESLEYLIDLETKNTIQKAKNWEPNLKDIEFISLREFALEFQNFDSYLKAFKKVIGGEKDESLNEIKFDKFLKNLNLSNKDLAVAYCYWKMQKDPFHEVPVKVFHINLHLKLEGFSSEDESSIKSSFEKLNKIFSDMGLDFSFKFRSGNGINNNADSANKPVEKPSPLIEQNTNSISAPKSVIDSLVDKNTGRINPKGLVLSIESNIKGIEIISIDGQKIMKVDNGISNARDHQAKLNHALDLLNLGQLRIYGSDGFNNSSPIQAKNKLSEGSIRVSLDSNSEARIWGNYYPETGKLILSKTEKSHKLWKRVLYTGSK